MPFGPLRRGRRIDVVVLSVVLTLSLAVCAQSVQMIHANEAESGKAPITMTFHMRSLVVSYSTSIFVYNGAERDSPPTYSTPITTLVSCSSSSGDFEQFLPSSAKTWLSGGNVWAGGVVWITQPLGEDLAIRGNASITVWMSSSDDEVSESGYVLGITELVGMVNIVGEPMYHYYQASGSVLQSSPSPHRLTFSVDRTFAKDNIIAFFVFVGSTSKGWQFQVYFDSPGMNSFAELPLDGAPIPEFPQMGALATVSVAMLASYLLTRRRTRA